ncbi:hypothetical protein [Rossellomorea marisflavi]|uniref:hypothetical protein n=1 Tax=Rossellomorea marisflavi TaxID=189381 RepID=UPI0012E93E38|nr:hypothetical protein [Rossellomorea marisflavi]
MKCNGGRPTLMGVAGRVRPCRLAEAAHRTPHGKRAAAVERNGLTPTNLPIKIKKENAHHQDIL